MELFYTACSEAVSQIHYESQLIFSKKLCHDFMANDSNAIKAVEQSIVNLHRVGQRNS
jgi:hypothetical protein